MAVALPADRTLFGWKRAPKPGLVPPMAGAAICLLLGIVVLASWFATEQTKQAGLVRHALLVEQHIASLMSGVQDVETGMRGFLLAGEDDYLEPYNNALPQIAGELQSLARLTADNPRQSERLRVLDRAVTDRLSTAEANISLMRTHGVGDAIQLVRTGSGRAAMERVRAIAATMRREEARLLDQRTNQMLIAGQRLRLSVLGCAIVILLLGTAILASLQAHRRELLAANSKLRLEIDARRETEGQMVQMQKMEAIGQLTGGIAHDFNNMLAVVIGALNLIKRRLDRGDRDVGSLADAAIDAARRAAALTSRLLAFSRQQPLNPETLDANQVVAGMSALLHQTLGTNIEIETVLAAGLWNVRADASQLENTILNLALNARDAMGTSGGKLTIETANSHLDDAYARAHADIPAGQYSLIAISDTGPGMTSEVLAKVFDPFFTTKLIGEGTGLGLSQAFGFVKQSGGHIKIYSEVGHGTVVKIYLPRVVGNSVRAVIKKRADEMARGDPASVILVVDDEERVCQITVASLRELGYTVVHAAGPSEALVKLRAHPNIDLLFTDIVMPGMNGRVLAERATSEHPGLKVLFASGYAPNAAANSGAVDVGQDFLMKPFSMEALAAKVATALATAA